MIIKRMLTRPGIIIYSESHELNVILDTIIALFIESCLLWNVESYNS